MRILVTGGAGFIGSHIVDLLIKNNHQVAIIDNLSSGNTNNINKSAKFFKEDICNYEKVSNIFQEFQPEVIYHLAAQIDVRKSVDDPISDAQINILAALNILQLCLKNNVKHFIFSSTGGAIYGDQAIIPTKENEKEQPISPYGCAKLTIEKYLNFYNKVHNLKYTCLRYANVYGPRQNSKGEAGVISIFLNKMLKNENPIIFGGNQTRDFVYVKDVAQANILALTDKESNTYNIGTGKETSITELFNFTNTFFNNQFQAIIEDPKRGEQQRSCLDSNKIKEHLGWTQQYNLQQGLKETYDWFKYYAKV